MRNARNRDLLRPHVPVVVSGPVTVIQLQQVGGVLRGADGDLRRLQARVELRRFPTAVPELHRGHSASGVVCEVVRFFQIPRSTINATHRFNHFLLGSTGYFPRSIIVLFKTPHY